MTNVFCCFRRPELSGFSLHFHCEPELVVTEALTSLDWSPVAGAQSWVAEGGAPQMPCRHLAPTPAPGQRLLGTRPRLRLGIWQGFPPLPGKSKQPLARQEVWWSDRLKGFGQQFS